MASSQQKRKFLGTSRETNLIARYNLTEEAYLVLLQAQHYKCKICGAETTDKVKLNLCVDHDHKTGQIRGLLCGSCNQMLGFAKENPVILLKAIQYLKGKL